MEINSKLPSHIDNFTRQKMIGLPEKASPQSTIQLAFFRIHMTMNTMQTMSTIFKKDAGLGIWLKLLILASILFGPGLTFGQNTYKWTGIIDSDWTKGGNWDKVPENTDRVVATNDILLFDKGGALTVTNVPSETIGQLSVAAGTIVNLQAGAAGNILTINGGTGTDLEIVATAQLNIDGTNVLNINLANAATGSVSGNMTFSNASHSVTGTNPGAIQFTSGAVFKQDIGCNGNVFGSGGTDGIVVFTAGSAFVAKDGANPFGTGTKVVFQTGSLYSHQHNYPPSLSGRTYADFEIQSSAYNRFFINPGTAPWTVDNLIVTATGGPTGYGVDHQGPINIRKNITVNSGATLTFAPATAINLNFNGTALQTISGAGLLTFNANTNIVVANGATVSVQKALNLAGSLTVNTGGNYSTAVGNTVTYNKGITNNGTFNAIGNTTFTTNSQVLSGSKTLTFKGNVTIDGAITISNENTFLEPGVQIEGILNGTVADSKFENQKILYYTNGAQPMVTGSLNASTADNTIYYNAGTQAIAPTIYHHLVLNNGYKSLGSPVGTTTVNGNLTIEGSASLQVGSHNLTVQGKTAIRGNFYDDNVNGVNSLNWVVLESSASISSTNGVAGTVNITTFDLNGGGANGGISYVGNVQLTVTGNTTIYGPDFRTLNISSAAGSKTFNNIAIGGKWNNSANAPVTITGSLTENSSNPNSFLAGSGIYTFSGGGKTISGTKPMLFTQATFTGSYTASGPDVQITNPIVNSGGKFTNNTGAFPVIMPASTAFRAFNNTSLAFVNKFDVFTAATGTEVTANNTDLTFTHTTNAGAVSAVRTRSFNPIPGAVKVTFQLSASNTGPQTNAGALMIGNNLSAAAPAGSASWLRFNLENTDKVSVTIPDGATFDANNANRTFTWVVNPGTANITYTGPNAIDRPLNAATAHLWLDGALLGTFSVQNPGQALSQIKFVMDQGNGSISLKNLRINPLATITTNAFTNTCVSNGDDITISYKFNESSGGALANDRAQSINEGSEIYVQLSDKDGNFNPYYYNNYVMVRRDKVPGTLSPNDVLVNSSLKVQLPLFATGPNYRYRVVVSEPGDTRPNMVSSSQPLFRSGQAASILYIAPSIPQSFLSTQTGNTLTVTTPTAATSYQWFYKSASDITGTMKPISGATTSTYAPKGSDFGTQGSYYVSCRVSYGSCSSVYSNEVEINIVCSTGANLVKNGNFNDYIVGTAQNVVINNGTKKISGTGTQFKKDLRPGRKLYSYDYTYLATVISIEDDFTINVDNATSSSPITYNSTSFISNYNEIPLQGTITTSSNNKIVDGVNTQFLGQLKAGYELRTNNNSLIGTVASISSNTRLMLVNNASVVGSDFIYKTNADDFLYPGTISADISSNIVTGINTTFALTNGGVVKQVEAGDIIRIINNSSVITLGTVASVQSNTKLTLTQNSLATVSGASYVANPPLFGTSGSQFDTQYRYTSWNMYPEGNFVVGLNPNYYHWDFCSMTSDAQRSASIGGSGGNMLIVNASTSSTQKVWQQNITVEPNTNYILTFNAVSLAGSANSLIFGAYINCFRVGDDITSDYTNKCQWRKYSILINSGNNTSFELGIANISATAAGNDVAIDDIQFFKCPEVVTVPFPQLARFRWRGYTNNWFSSDNWGVCPGILPTCSDDIEIPADVPYYPIVKSTDAGGMTPIARTVRVNSGASLTINPDINLNVCGDINNDGTINALANSGAAAKVTFIGYGAATIKPSPLPTQQSIKTTSNSPFGDVIVNQNPVMTGGISLTTDVTVNGQLDIHHSNTVVLNTNTLTLNGTLSASTGTITGSPASKLIVGGTGDVGGPLRFTAPATSTSTEQTLGFLHMNRAAGKLTLGTPLLLKSILPQTAVLRLDNGIIYTSLIPVLSPLVLTLDENAIVTNSILPPAPSTMSKGSDASHINGPMDKKMVNALNTNFTFPVGDASKLGEIGVTPNANTATTFRAQYFWKDPRIEVKPTLGIDPTLHHISGYEYWDLTPTPHVNAFVSLHWTANTTVSTLATDWKELRVAHYNSNTQIWENKGPGAGYGTNPTVPAGTYASGRITSTLMTSFSPFTFGSTISNNPLPIQLVDLKASVADKTVKLNWVTLNEQNSDYFEVQRSYDGKTFITIGKVAAAGASTKALSYSFVDANPAAMNYYRLNMVDKDQKSGYSKTVTAQLSLRQDIGQIAVEVFPNPFDGKTLYLKADYVGKVTVTFINILGKEVYRETLTTGSDLTTINPKTELLPGAYIMTLQAGNQTTKHKVVVK